MSGMKSSMLLNAAGQNLRSESAASLLLKMVLSVFRETTGFWFFESTSTANIEGRMTAELAQCREMEHDAGDHRREEVFAGS